MTKQQLKTTKTQLDRAIDHFRQATLWNILNGLDSDRAREDAIALFRAAAMKVQQ